MPKIEYIARPPEPASWHDDFMAASHDRLQDVFLPLSPDELALPVVQPTDMLRFPGMTLQHATDIAHEFSDLRERSLDTSLHLKPNRIIIKLGRVMMGMTETKEYVSERKQVTDLLQRVLRTHFQIVPSYTNICLGTVSPFARDDNKRRGDIIHTLTDRVMPPIASFGAVALCYSFGDGKLEIVV